MRRIFHATAVASRPAVPPLAGVEGFFTNGDPAASVPATVVPAWWLNQLQEEFLSIILAAGLTPDANNLSQVLAAIRALTPTNINQVTFLSSGTYTPHPKLILARVRVIGGGAGGGGATGGSSGSSGGGGGGGAYSEGTYSRATIGSSRAIVVGAGGSGGAFGASGTNGGLSSLAGIINANGGGAGGGAGDGLIAGGGIGGGSAGGHINIPGAGGSTGALGVGGAGGGNPLGTGGVLSYPTAATGAYGNGYGGGGAGAGATLNGRIGGAGTQGAVFIEELIGS
ncbi:hypothetical protein [Muricoccus aerilatus]|uniref:hypothetical protein n=1 Tax=Muricoccus aerilatus TaxID=452982 RepID=UPI0006945F7E|nr:hypothetical protein [Roseomonas aerilata]